eukprot:RCo047127
MRHRLHVVLLGESGKLLRVDRQELNGGERAPNLVQRGVQVLAGLAPLRREVEGDYRPRVDAALHIIRGERAFSGCLLCQAEGLLQLPILLELPAHVQTTNELALYKHLREGGPVRDLLEVLPHFFVGQHVEMIVFHPCGIDELKDLCGKPTAGNRGGALDEKHDLAAVDQSFQPVLQRDAGIMKIARNRLQQLNNLWDLCSGDRSLGTAVPEHQQMRHRFHFVLLSKSWVNLTIHRQELNCRERALQLVQRGIQVLARFAPLRRKVDGDHGPGVDAALRLFCGWLFGHPAWPREQREQETNANESRKKNCRKN